MNVLLVDRLMNMLVQRWNGHIDGLSDPKISGSKMKKREKKNDSHHKHFFPSSSESSIPISAKSLPSL